MSSVLLFRSPSLTPREDDYHKVLLDAGFKPFSIPVLSFKFENQQELVQKLEKSGDYGGMILTSQRAVEAIEKCVTDIISQEVWRTKMAKIWQQKCIFVVGKATRNAASDKLGLESSGFEAGSAESLVPIILQAVEPGSNPLLFPCGNLRRETIPVEMAKAGIVLDGVQAYTTCADPKIKESLKDFVMEKGFPSYAVFFSPSGVTFTEEILSGLSGWHENVKLVAIGKTTAEAMKSKSWNVTAVAEKPSPQALAQCIADSSKAMA